MTKPIIFNECPNLIFYKILFIKAKGFRTMVIMISFSVGIALCWIKGQTRFRARDPKLAQTF